MSAILDISAAKVILQLPCKSGAGAVVRVLAFHQQGLGLILSSKPYVS